LDDLKTLTQVSR